MTAAGMEAPLIEPVLSASKRLKREVDALSHVRQAGTDQLRAIAASTAEEDAHRRPRLDADIASCDEQLGSLRQELAALGDRHYRRAQVGQLHAALIALQGEFVDANKSAKMAKQKLEVVCEFDIENADVDDPEISDAMRRERTHRATVEQLKRRRECLLSNITDLSRVTPIAQADIPAEDEAEVPVGAAPAAELDFPDLPVLALRIFKKVPKKSTNARDKARRNTESLLRRDGLLVEDRSMQDYTEEDIPDVMLDATGHKTNVKGRRLSGAQSRPLKILKEIPQREYKQLKRAIVTAHRLRHPGVVPVECAFMEKDNIVIQSRFFAGGNMRQWCPGQPQEARLAAARRVAEAVQFLHSKGIIHRDIKPENIVFDGETEDALPALCDFDISVDTLETMAATAVRGTPVYMAPEPELSMATDVYALGVTLYDLLHCDGVLSRLPKTGMGMGLRFDAPAAIADLNSRGDPCARLLTSMLSEEPSARLTAEQVVTELVDVVDEATHRDCCSARVCAGRARMPLQSGLECPATTPHFACDECLSADMVTRQIPGLTVGNLGLTCCGCAAPMDQKTMLEHVDQQAYDQFFAKIEELQEAQLELQLELRVKEETDKLLRLSELGAPRAPPGTRVVLTSRRHNVNPDPFLGGHFDRACTQFHDMIGPGNHATVSSVEYYGFERSELQMAFDAQKVQFEQAHKSVDEIWVFHGTATEAAITSIMANGFKVGGQDVGVANGTAHGQGVYSACGPNTPMGYGQGTNSVILAKALPGDCQTDCRSPRGDWRIFTKKEQVLPCYVIRFS